MGYIENLRAKIGHDCVILPGSAVIIRNKEGRVLMQQRKYPHGRWALPGGLMELGESAEETARREIMEETGLSLGALTLLGVYSGKGYLCEAANGDQWYVVTITYIAESYEGIPRVNDDESLAFEWIDPEFLPENTAKTHRIMIGEYLEKRGTL
ncbi:MAG: NUDIX domain-containing protein [Clostridia bacterium]|nr:NUDIX domain-containing protein [Clostridia bacterium]